MSSVPAYTPLSRSQIVRLLILVAIYLLVVYVAPRPPTIVPEGWRLLGIFAATIAGLILQPIPGGALVLLSITLASISGALSVARALSGYADPSVWLVLAAFFISRALINTGLARRIALFFVRIVGNTSLGLCYALGLSDMVLAMLIPSNGARSGGVILPIARSIAELYGSSPGPTATRLGSYLLPAVYQSICITTAMFMTGQASNPQIRVFAAQFGYDVTVGGWMLAGIVPGLCSLALVPMLILKLNPPEIRKTPEAAIFAAEQLRAMGPLATSEKILAAVFVGVCGMWVTSSWHGMDVTLTALAGSCALLVTGVLTWEDVKNERTAWDLFIWYGGLIMLGRALNDFHITEELARGVGSALAWAPWTLLFGIALLVYFYTHYALASITAHILAMYPPFLAVLIAKGAPIGLVVYAFGCFVNLSAGLTHYGTTPAPMFFAQDYASMKLWWKIGFYCSLANLLIWSTLGFGWWKLVGIW